MRLILLRMQRQGKLAREPVEAVYVYSLTSEGRQWLRRERLHLKLCTKCQRTLRLGAFKRSRMGRWGRSSWCRRCFAQARNRRRYVNGEDAHYKSKSHAKRSGMGWSLSKAQHQAMMRLPCYYCGFPLPKLRAGSGLDRLDNSRGYDRPNVVPCCPVCNVVRRDFFTPQEMRCTAPFRRRLGACYAGGAVFWRRWVADELSLRLAQALAGQPLASRALILRADPWFRAARKGPG